MNVLVTGATGYIGGAVALALRDTGHRVSGLTRSEDKGEQLRRAGIDPVLGTLFDTALITYRAKQADAVINAADSDNPYVVTSLLAALEGSGKTLIHTSGSSIVGDRSAGSSADSVYSEETRPKPRLEKAGRVAIDDAVLGATALGIRSIVICPSMVYGHGAGIHTESVQIPMLRNLATSRRAGVHVGEGTNRWSNVHIEDLAALYQLALDSAPGGRFFFAENGEASMIDIAAALAHALGFGRNIESIDIPSAVTQLGAEAAEFALASNSRVRAIASRALGWKPRHDDLLEGLRTLRY